MHHRSEKHDRTTDTHGPIQLGSPLYLAVSQIAASIAKTLDESGRHQYLRCAPAGRRDKNEPAEGLTRIQFQGNNPKEDSHKNPEIDPT